MLDRRFREPVPDVREVPVAPGDRRPGRPDRRSRLRSWHQEGRGPGAARAARHGASSLDLGTAAGPCRRGLGTMSTSPAGALTAAPTGAFRVPVEPAGRDLLARFYRALGDPTRLALLAFCAEQERTGSECVAHAGLSQGRVSAHLACLVSCGLMEVRRAGRFAYYEVTDPRVAELVELGASMVVDHASGVAACARVAPAP